MSKFLQPPMPRAQCPLPTWYDVHMVKKLTACNRMPRKVQSLPISLDQDRMVHSERYASLSTTHPMTLVRCLSSMSTVYTVQYTHWFTVNFGFNKACFSGEIGTHGETVYWTVHGALHHAPRQPCQLRRHAPQGRGSSILQVLKF